MQKLYYASHEIITAKLICFYQFIFHLHFIMYCEAIYMLFKYIEINILQKYLSCEIHLSYSPNICFIIRYEISRNLKRHSI